MKMIELVNPITTIGYMVGYPYLRPYQRLVITNSTFYSTGIHVIIPAQLVYQRKPRVTAHNRVFI
jgi:hypothetical protein